MLEKPKNYEEAKLIIKNSVGDKLTNRYMKLNVLRSSLITLLTIGAATALGVARKSAMVGLACIPFASVISFGAFLPVIYQKRTEKRIKDDSYFVGKSEETIMRVANQHVDEYNRLEQNKKR